MLHRIKGRATKCGPSAISAIAGIHTHDAAAIIRRLFDRPKPERTSSIHSADRLLRQLWADRFANLPPEAREALSGALVDLRRDARKRAELQWRRNKAPMAFYWRVVAVYAGHLARALRAERQPPTRRNTH